MCTFSGIGAAFVLLPGIRHQVFSRSCATEETQGKTRVKTQLILLGLLSTQNFTAVQTHMADTDADTCGCCCIKSAHAEWTSYSVVLTLFLSPS